jgi:hypothetical protein
MVAATAAEETTGRWWYQGDHSLPAGEGTHKIFTIFKNLF